MTIDSAIAELKSVFGDRATTSASDRDIHGQNEAYFAPTPPDAVLYPETTDEVSRILSICHAHLCPVVPWGTGTSLEGHALAIRGGISLDMSRMNRVLAVHDADMDVVVQPGVTREDLNTELRATGLFFPIDPGANASLGGMASTRASGTTAVRYGTMRQNVLALEVVLADGRVIRTGSRARKTSAGYDLTGLFVGAEGTLGVITELTLRLHGQPEAVSAAICAFEDIEGAISAVIQTIQMGVPMARIEFVDAAMAEAFNRHFNADFPLKPHLLVEFHGSPSAVAEQAQRMGESAAEFGGSGFQWSAKPEDRARLWKMRHDGAYAAASLRPGATFVVTDICVPISRLAEAVVAIRADIDASGLVGPILGHVGDGNVHSLLLVMPGDAEELARARAVAHKMAQRALALGGTVTGEHGIGFGKLDYMEEEHGLAWGVMGDIKRTLDPNNLMNPGKMVRLN